MAEPLNQHRQNLHQVQPNLVLYLVDKPRLYPLMRAPTVTLDSAFTDERVLTTHLEHLFAGEVLRLKVKKVDRVSDTTVVDVRFRLNSDDRPVADAEISP